MPGPDRADRDRVDRFKRLLVVGRALEVEPDIAAARDLVLESARDLTGASLAEFREPSAGVADSPVADPERRVLDVPIRCRGKVLGSLHVAGGHRAQHFDEDDVDIVETLAGWAGLAMGNARLSSKDAAGRRDLERALRTMRTSMEIATAIGGDTDLERILELIVVRARTLVSADGLLIWLRQGDELRIAMVAGNADVPDDAVIPFGASTAGEALRAGRSVRVEDAQGMMINPAEFGMAEAISALIVPLMYRGQGLGVMVAFDNRLGATASFDADNERALEAFAASAATAVATARLVEEQRLHDSIAAAESERGRWARELHDETLQGLASLKISLTSAMRADESQVEGMLESAVAHLDHDIAALHTIIADLRPAALDELGLEPALRSLVAGVAETSGLEASVSIRMGAARLERDVETIAYRVAQEALTNVVRHADARTVTLEVVLDGGELRLVIADDGRGVGEMQDDEGYGIVGMRERATLASGEITISQASGGGTRVTLALPIN